MSLTIQAPHANMNAYEIGDDETRKTKYPTKEPYMPEICSLPRPQAMLQATRNKVPGNRR